MRPRALLLLLLFMGPHISPLFQGFSWMMLYDLSPASTAAFFSALTSTCYRVGRGNGRERVVGDCRASKHSGQGLWRLPLPIVQRAPQHAQRFLAPPTCFFSFLGAAGAASFFSTSASEPLQHTAQRSTAERQARVGLLMPAPCQDQPAPCCARVPLILAGPQQHP